MVGTKRKADTSNGSADGLSQAPPAADAITNSTLSGRSARARAGAARGPARTRASRGNLTREAPLADLNTASTETNIPTQHDPSAGNHAPVQEDTNTEGPPASRVKRRKVFGATEAVHPTRQSARIKARANSTSSVDSSGPQHLIRTDSAGPSPSDISTNGWKRKKTTVKTGSSTTQTTITDIAEVKSHSSKNASEQINPAKTAELSDANSGGEPTSLKLQNDPEIAESIETHQSLSQPSENITPKASGGKKRRADQIENDKATDLVDSINHVDKKLKLEHEQSSHTSQRPSQNGSDQGPDTTRITARQPEDREGQAGQTPRVEDLNPLHTRGRGRGRGGRGRGGRGRGRGTARGGTVIRGGRGRGRGGRGGGRGKRSDDDSDFEFERSLSPTPGTQRLQERQKELKQVWKKLGGVQRLALNALGHFEEQRLARDKNIHIMAPEYEVLMNDLAEVERNRQATISHQYKYKIEQVNKLFEAEREIIEKQFYISAEHIQQEHYRAAQGAYMTFVEGIQHDEDEDHTEPEVDRSGSEDGPSRDAYLYREVPRFKRGYNSSFVREPAGAAVYELATGGWEDFVQRAKMKEISGEAGPEGPDSISALLEAAEVVDSEAPPTALLALADAAAERPNPLPTTSRSGAHRPILPQPPSMQPTGPPEPSPYFLPRPPTQQRLPPFSDAFTAPGGGRPQLPPPPGVTFTPMPAFLQGPQSHQHHRPHQAGPQQFYFPPGIPQGLSPPHHPRPY